MNTHRPNHQYSRIIIQIDSLKKQVYQLIKNIQQRPIIPPLQTKSTQKQYQNQQKSQKIVNFTQSILQRPKQNKQNQTKRRSRKEKVCEIKKISNRVAKIEKSNEQIKKQAKILQNQLLLQKSKTQILEKRLLRTAKASIGIQTSLQTSKSCRLFTPANKNTRQQLRAKYICSNTRDEQENDTLLLETVNQLSYCSPKRIRKKLYEFNVIDSTNDIAHNRLSTFQS